MKKFAVSSDGRIRVFLRPGSEEIRVTVVLIALIGNLIPAAIAASSVSGSFGVALVLLTMFVAIAGITVEVRRYRAQRPRRFSRHEATFPYMARHWSRCSEEDLVVVGRNMSPAQSPEVRPVLEQQAASGNLTICVPPDRAQEPVIRELVSLGAKVCLYPADFEPRTRFSFVRWNAADEELLLGGWHNSEFEIRAFRSNDSDMAAVLTRHLAHDLVRLIHTVPDNL